MHAHLATRRVFRYAVQPRTLPHPERDNDEGFREVRSGFTMAKVWNIRKRHVWLTKPLKGKYLSKRKRERIGLQEAMDRKAEGSNEEPAAEQG